MFRSFAACSFFVLLGAASLGCNGDKGADSNGSGGASSSTGSPEGSGGSTGGAPGGTGGSTSNGGAIGSGGSDTTSGGTGGGSTSLPLGTVSQVKDVDCSGGGTSCKTLTVSCPGVSPSDATLQIYDAPDATRTVTIIGPGGGTAFYDKSGLVQDYLAKKFRVVQIKWSDDWEYSEMNPSVKAAACRPATLYRWVFDNIHQGASAHAYCVHGSSGGSGAVGFALTQYGMKDTIDYALMSFGPVFSEIQYGCDTKLYNGPARNLCPQLTNASFAYNHTTNEQSLNKWEDTHTCVSGGASPADIQKWTDDSIDTRGDFDWPKTGTTYYYCVPANAGAGLGTFFIDQAHAATQKVTCFDDCQSEDLNQDDVTKMVADMDDGCVPRH